MLASVRTVIEGFDRSDWIAIAAAGFALLSGIAAVRSNALAREANSIARDANDISADARDLVARSVELDEVAHEERRAEREARAELSAELDPSELRSSGSSANFRPTLLISNTGVRDSGRAHVEFFAPQYISSLLLAWDDEHQRSDRTRARAAPDVELIDTTGRAFPAHCLDRHVENISVSMPARLRLVFPVDIPVDPLVIPLRAVVHAEHMDHPLVADLSVTVARGSA